VPASFAATGYSSTSTLDPLLAATSLRVDVHGVPAIDGLSVTSSGEHVLVLGAASALFEAAAGLRAAARGALRIEGKVPIEAVREGVAAGAPLDPPMPPRWTVGEYVTWSARLAGHSRRLAKDLAGDALSRMALGTTMRAKLGTAVLSVRRATVLAAALATGATTLLVEDPITGLPAESAPQFTRAMVRALAERRTIFFAGRVRLESPVALAADEAIVLFGSHVAAQGAPAEIAAGEHAFVLRMVGDVRAFAAALEAEGAHVLGGADGETPSRVSVDLGPLATRDLLRIAAASKAVVLELRPIALAFA
jgi:ABC-type multidrug transport system ATPase subunit